MAWYQAADLGKPDAQTLFEDILLRRTKLLNAMDQQKATVVNARGAADYLMNQGSFA